MAWAAKALAGREDYSQVLIYLGASIRFGSIRTTMYVIDPLISLNQCGVPAGITTTSPALIFWITPPWMEVPLAPGPSSSLTDMASAGLAFALTIVPPVTSVPAPSIT